MLRSSWVGAGLATPAPIPRRQTGQLSAPGTSGTVVFPVAFSQVPIVTHRVLAPNVMSWVEVTSVTLTGFTWVAWQHPASGTSAPTSLNPSTFEWIAEVPGLTFQ